MGFFSWLTSDTQRSISNVHSNRGVFTVHMVTECGQIFTENAYQGYGEFNGVDIFALIAKLQGHVGTVEVETRKDFGDEWQEYYAPGEDNEELRDIFFKDLCKDDSDLEILAEQGLKVPKLVENLPSVDVNWQEWWNNLPYPKRCPEQGFFYGDIIEVV